MVYYNLVLIPVVLAIVNMSYNNIVFTWDIAEI